MLKLGGCNLQTLAEIKKSIVPYFKDQSLDIFLDRVIYSPGCQAQKGGRNFKERVTIGLFFRQKRITIEVNSTRSLCTIVFEYSCHRLNE